MFWAERERRSERVTLSVLERGEDVFVCVCVCEYVCGREEGGTRREVENEIKG